MHLVVVYETLATLYLTMGRNRDANKYAACIYKKNILVSNGKAE